uniref:Uncharacterized protein n=1 Tax=Magallana gigas TaxID=29159 RepID=K1PKI9_MAGGI
MFRRKLCALRYHQPDTFKVEDEDEFRSFILWLEDQKICHYKIEDRAGLRNIKSSDWTKAYESYLKDLGCPYHQTERVNVAGWILGYAIRLEYGDNVEEYKKADPSNIAMTEAGRVPSTNPLDNLDFNDADFKAGVTSLSMILQIPPHTDHLEQLKGEQLPLDQTDLGFDTGDYIINEAAKILRLIHIKNLRDLQTQINSAIVGVQALIANPKTDSRLGKVGF